MERPKSNMPGVEQLNGMSVEARIELGKKHVEEGNQIAKLRLRIDNQLKARKDLSPKAKGKLAQQILEEGKAEIHKKIFG